MVRPSYITITSRLCHLWFKKQTVFGAKFYNSLPEQKNTANSLPGLYPKFADIFVEPTRICVTNNCQRNDCKLCWDIVVHKNPHPYRLIFFLEYLLACIF